MVSCTASYHASCSLGALLHGIGLNLQVSNYTTHVNSQNPISALASSSDTPRSHGHIVL